MKRRSFLRNGLLGAFASTVPLAVSADQGDDRDDQDESKDACERAQENGYPVGCIDEETIERRKQRLNRLRTGETVPEETAPYRGASRLERIAHTSPTPKGWKEESEE